jgi:hypothetical protein
MEEEKFNACKTIKELTYEKIKVLVEESNSSTDILRKLNISTDGFYIKLMRKTIRGHGLMPPYKRKFKKELIDNHLTENSTLGRESLKKRLIENKMLENKCQICGLGPEWQGIILSLQIDHINGVNNDNRIENLRMLCPNCHSQTDTYAGKRLKNLRKCKCGGFIDGNFDKCAECVKLLGQQKEISRYKTVRCDKCGEFKCNNTITCFACAGPARQKFSPSKEELEELIFKENQTLTQLGKKYGVSDNAVKKRCINLKIDISHKNKKEMQEKYRIKSYEETSDSEIMIKIKDNMISKKELKKLLFEDNMSYLALSRKFNTTPGTIKYNCKLVGIDLSLKEIKITNESNNESDNESDNISEPKKIVKVVKKKYTKLCVCGNITGKYSTQCNECKNKKKQKYEITKEEMENLLFIEDMSYSEIGRKFNVRGDSVRKRCIRMGIDVSNKSKSNKSYKEEESSDNQDTESLYYISDNEPITPKTKIRYYESD